MDTLSEMGYPMRHETLWKTRSVGKAKTSRHPAAESRAKLSCGGRRGACIVELRCTLAAGVSQERPKRASAPEDSWTSLPVECPSEAKAPTETRAWGLGGRIFHPDVDSEADRRGDPKAMRSSLQHLQPLAPDDPPGVELPKADQASQGETRCGDPLLARARLASYKKRQKSLEPIWPSWMRVVSCSYPSSREAGHPKAAPPSCAQPDAGPNSRLSRPLPCRPRASVWVSRSAFTPTRTSEPVRSSAIFASFFGICEATSCSFGTAVPSIKPALSKRSWLGTLGFIPTASQVMLRSSTPMSSSGRTSREPRPTAFPETWRISGSFSNRRCAGSAALNDCSVPASWLRNYHGNSIHYLSECQ